VKRISTIGIICLTSILFIWLLAISLNIQLIDFENYITASRMLWQRKDPYGAVEFFAPPWFAFLLLPLLHLPTRLSGSLWLFISFLSVIGSVLISASWLGLTHKGQKLFLTALLASLMPGVWFSYITGQASPLVGLGLLVCAWAIASGTAPLLAGLGFLLATLKPNLVVFPLLLCLFELVRSRNWRTTRWIAGCFLVVTVLASIMLPDWFLSLFNSWRSGDYRGGKPGLIAPGYFGLPELGIAWWVFVPLAVFTVSRWWKDGLRAEVFALALVVNVLLSPYSRSYDQVLLILPFLVVASSNHPRGYGLLSLAAIAVFLVPLTALAVLTPVLLAILLLLRMALNQRMHPTALTGRPRGVSDSSSEWSP
jgi:hypothetical protein